jgi:DNA-binding CsgD family transcriptional regulator
MANMAKGEFLNEVDSKTKQLENKIKELEKANLKLQEYFSKISGKFSERDQTSPYSGNPFFSCVFKFTIDLELQKLVWSNAENKTLTCNPEKLFLADINILSSKLIAKADKKRFAEIVKKYSGNYHQPTQTLFRVNHSNKNSIWVLACFEKITYQPLEDSYLQVQFVKLDENQEITSLFNEYLKKVEKGENYRKIENLTDRQREILSLLGKGFTSKEIADMLCISFHTVEAHRKTIAKKTQTKKRAALIFLAAEAGIIQ